MRSALAVCLGVLLLCWAGLADAGTQEPGTIGFETSYARFEVNARGQVCHLIDRATKKDYCAGPTSFAFLRRSGVLVPATALVREGQVLTLSFGQAGLHARLRVVSTKPALVLEVLSVSGDGVTELLFGNVPLSLQGTREESFACTALALNLRTNVAALPGPSSSLQASCYSHLGFAGAKVALVAAPQARLRGAIQAVVRESGALPVSPRGGPWAWEPAENHGSYLFDFGEITDQTVGEWTALVQALGFTQINFHGGRSFRFGDFQLDPDLYPRGRVSLKKVIDALHAAGIQAGLQTYSYFIDPRAAWVTPVPDARLAADSTFTLAQALGTDATEVPVLETTDQMTAVTGFFVRNSAALQIEDELITYQEVGQSPARAFLQCTRGAYGTRAAAHPAGAKVRHLRQCFGLFAPDPNTTLFAEVAARTADLFNTCGFDMIYLDALDGSDLFEGPEWSWYYGSKFAFELYSRLRRPSTMEMSTFHHHLWYVRSRLGALDHPTRGHKRFIDLHVAANREYDRIYLPGNLGWWALLPWNGAQQEPTFPDDIEYLCVKALATEAGLSLMGITPASYRESPGLARLAAIFKRYADLRRRGVPEPLRARLRAPGEEFTFDGTQFRPVEYAKHTVQGLDGWSDAWRVRGRFAAQPLHLRIEALLSAAPYGSAEGVTLAGFDTGEFDAPLTQQGVQAEMGPAADRAIEGQQSGRFSAMNTSARPTAAWAGVQKTFWPVRDVSGQQALGVWVYGDGQGEVLNVQVRSPEPISSAIGEHYVPIDFTGWRYFTLIEPEGERWSAYEWPYAGGGAYSIYRESVDYGHLASLGLWYNNLPTGQPVTSYLSPIRALPLVPVMLRNPRVTIGGATLTFPAELPSGWYIEFQSLADCTLYDPTGRAVRAVVPQGEVPTVAAGENQVRFECDTGEGGPAPRAKVTLITYGDPVAQ